jgi:hypothetical protein
MQLWNPGSDRPSDRTGAQKLQLPCRLECGQQYYLFEILEISDKRCPATTRDAFPIAKGESPFRHQNQPPDGSRPLMRRYVTRLP